MTEETKTEPEPPFNVGDLVTLRAKDAKLVKYKHLPRNDLGVVVGLKFVAGHYTKTWHVFVEWQQYQPKSLKRFKCYHTRLKKVR
jgi:hypothetical protein